VLKVDLHIHTSEDPFDIISYDARALVDRAAACGFDAIAVTLHDRQLMDSDLTSYARERGIVLIPGIERTIGRKHILLLNFPAARAEAVSSLDDVAVLKREHPEGLVIAPHPFFPGASPLRELMDAHAALFDAVEWSYFWTPLLNFNRAAEQWARTHGKPLVGNSDMHDIRQIGRTYSLVDASRDADAICGAIRQGRVEVVTSAAPVAELVLVFGGLTVRDLMSKPKRWQRTTDAGARGAQRPEYSV
jgi:predicted metal-dependent phosphoesterase TrpH